MLAFENMLNMQLMMFLLVFIGFLIRKKGIVGEMGRKNLIDLCIQVTLPFNIFQSFMGEWKSTMLYSFITILILSVGYNFISILIGKCCYRKTEAQRKKPLQYATIVSNGGFLGNPVIEGIYGAQGLFYASVFMLPVRIVMWTIGTSCFLKGEKEKLLKKIVLHPCIVAIYAGMACMVASISLPVFVNKTIWAVSGCNMPVSMMLVGMMLAEMNPKGLIDKTLIWFTGLRLIIIPLVIFGVTALFPIDPLFRGITVIIAGMPAPITTALLSAKYKGDEDYATALIFVSTIASLITLPIWTLML